MSCPGGLTAHLPDPDLVPLEKMWNLLDPYTGGWTWLGRSLQLTKIRESEDIRCIIQQERHAGRVTPKETVSGFLAFCLVSWATREERCKKPVSERLRMIEEEQESFQAEASSLWLVEE